MSRQDPKLEVERLYKIFGKDPRRALKLLDRGAPKDEVLEQTGNVVGVSGVSFHVARGEIFVVMGLSGSGKSTLIRCINRLIAPTRGRIAVEGEDVVAMDRDALRRMRLERMAMVFQHFALFPHMTVWENVAFGLKIRGMDEDARRDKAMRALELVGLEAWAQSPPANLSGGMQQRVGLARGLAVDPEILLMDEPFSALDPLIRRDMQLELIELQRTIGNAIVFITHDLHEALVLGDRIAIMKDGRFVQVGTPEAIVTEPADDYVAEFTRDIDRGRVLKIGSIAERAEAIVLDEASATAASEHLRQLGRDAVHVVDRQGRPVGLVTRHSLKRAADESARSLGEAMLRDPPKAPESARLIEAYGQGARGLPLAVVDAQGRLTGSVTPAAMLDALANGESEKHGSGEAPDGNRAVGERSAPPPNPNPAESTTS